MKKQIGNIYRYVIIIRNRIQWMWESIYEKRKIKPVDNLKQNFSGICLILIPHSDDEWIGCSRIITNCKNVVLCNMDMSGDDSDSLHQERYIEMQSVQKVYKHQLITIKDNKVDCLNALIKEVTPDFIFIPHFIDWHPEHIEVMRILSLTLKKITDNHIIIVMYQVSCPILSGITHAIPMSKKEWHLKWKFFKKHYPSQLCIPYRRFSLNEVINGKYTKSYAAEVFCSLSSEEWINKIAGEGLNVEQINSLMHNLSSISKMRSYIKNEFA